MLEATPCSRHRALIVSAQTDLSELRQSADRYRKGSLGKRLLSLVLGLLLVLIGLELVVRSALGSTPYSIRIEMTEIVSAMSERVPDAYRAEDAAEVVDETMARIIPHPFTAWDDQSSTQRLERDFARANELRSNEGARAKTFRVMVTGGSVALLFRRRGAKVLAEELMSRGLTGGREIEFLHYARAAFKQPQQVNQLTYLLAMGIDADLVINIDGYNELAIGQKNVTVNTHPIYPGIRFWGHVSGGGSTDPEVLDRITSIWMRQRGAQEVLERYSEGLASYSSLVGEMHVRKLRQLREEWLEAQQQYTQFIATYDETEAQRGPAFDGSFDEVLEFLGRSWAECSVSMHAMCHERGIDYLHVLQPTLADASAGKPLDEFEQEQIDAYRVNAVNQAFETVQVGYDLLRARGLELTKSGIDFLDATQAFAGVEEALYTDFVHFNRAGNELLAKRIADWLVPLLK
ncbi:MAG: hypothetical protein ACI835_005731 [Planctomycetota bacterium]|jgi:hypothetical protein